MDATQAAVRCFKAARAGAEQVRCALAPQKTPAAALLRVCAVVLVKDAGFLPADVRDSWAESLGELRESLGYDTAPPLERMLIEHACVCWIRLAVMEVRYSCVVTANNTLAQIAHTERQLTEAQRRFNRACVALAKVRKLARPNVQINVAAAGGQQVNVA